MVAIIDRLEGGARRLATRATSLPACFRSAIWVLSRLPGEFEFAESVVCRSALKEESVAWRLRCTAN